MSAGAKKILFFCLTLVAIPLVIVMGVVLFEDRRYNVISMLVALLVCVPFFVGFERGRSSARELVVIAVMTAISVVGRLVFAPLPGFKPVTAIVIITGIAYGAEAGFLTGSLSAVVSNIFYGQGPWTPFQMFVWGMIGLLSGLIFARRTRPNLILVCIVGAVGGALFSLMMDVWTTISFEGTFDVARYLAYVVTSMPFMAIYSVSNVIFLLVLARPLLTRLNRISTKYGVFRRPTTPAPTHQTSEHPSDAPAYTTDSPTEEPPSVTE